MHTRKFVVAALALGLGALAATPSQAQVRMDPKCSRAVESEVRGRYAEAQNVEVTAVADSHMSDAETGYSGAGFFEDQAGARMDFLFDCISGARAEQAYGVSVRRAPRQLQRSVQADQSGGVVAEAAPAAAMIAAVARNPQGAYADVGVDPAPASAGMAAPAPMKQPPPAPPPASGVVEEAMMPPPAPASSQTVEEAMMAPPAAGGPCAAMAAGCAQAMAMPAMATPAPVLAGAEAEAPRRTEAPRAFDAALARMAQDLPQAQVAVLRFAAHATTAASVCPNIELNDQAVVGTLTNVVQAMSLELTPQQAARRRDTALIAYGMLTGLMLHEASINEAAFCANAARDAGEAGSWSFMRVRDQR